LSISHIKTELNLAENLPDLTVDANQIQQVFLNLIGNAADAIGTEGGTIKITTKLIYLAPFGVAQVKQAVCPKGHDLVERGKRIDGLPSIKVKARRGADEGIIHIDPVYGKNDHDYSIDLTDAVDVEFECPKCNSSLMDRTEPCPNCGSPVYAFDIPGKGRFRGCTKAGCDWQHWASMEKEGIKEFVEVQLDDNGCGISKENLERVFEPFFTTKGQKGTGLGLSVTWGIIDKHDGSINIRSKLGVCTTVTIRLPVVDAGE
jgi:signal transduction histidine kinase